MPITRLPNGARKKKYENWRVLYGLRLWLTIKLLYWNRLAPVACYVCFLCLIYRKMQAGEVGASTSDILTDKAEDDLAHVAERCVRMEFQLTNLFLVWRNFTSDKWSCDLYAFITSLPTRKSRYLWNKFTSCFFLWTAKEKRMMTMKKMMTTTKVKRKLRQT